MGVERHGARVACWLGRQRLHAEQALAACLPLPATPLPDCSDRTAAPPLHADLRTHTHIHRRTHLRGIHHRVVRRVVEVQDGHRAAGAQHTVQLLRGAGMAGRRVAACWMQQSTACKPSRAKASSQP